MCMWYVKNLLSLRYYCYYYECLARLHKASGTKIKLSNVNGCDDMFMWCSWCFGKRPHSFFEQL